MCLLTDYFAPILDLIKDIRRNFTRHRQGEARKRGIVMRYGRGDEDGGRYIYATCR